MGGIVNFDLRSIIHHYSSVFTYVALLGTVMSLYYIVGLSVLHSFRQVLYIQGVCIVAQPSAVRTGCL